MSYLGQVTSPLYTALHLVIDALFTNIYVLRFLFQIGSCIDWIFNDLYIMKNFPKNFALFSKSSSFKVFIVG